MVHQGDIKEDMDVLGKDGTVFARVERVEGGTRTIKLARDVVTGVHHWIPLDWVNRVNKNGVHLNVAADLARLSWQDSPPHA